MTATPWYYDYHEPGTFPHQQELCKAVEWTRCNLEGRRLVSPTHLTDIPANPLTIRLLALRGAIIQLESNANPINEAIKKQADRAFSKGKMFGIGGTLVTQQSGSIKTSGAPIEVIRISGKRKPIEWSYYITHLALYEFFSNLSSVTDRLAFEIDLLYKLNIRKVDWPKLTDMSPSKDKHWKSLNNKDSNLARFINNYAPKFVKALAYRNRLVHDGIIRLEANFSVSGLSIYLAQNPDDVNAIMDVDALIFCKHTKEDILRLLDRSYDLMLQHHKTHGNPPW
jgi:hypothetical protein